MVRMTPIGALVRGIFAGAAGSFAQELFFAATAKLAPSPPKDAFAPPEMEQKNEMPTQTVARRVVEDLAERGPIEDKERAGKVVHYAFGSAWGGVYGLLAGSAAPFDTLAGSLGFGLGVWMLSDNVILPSFKLAGWPQRYPAQSHAYAIAAHLVYGATAFAAFELARRRTWIPLFAAIGAAWSTRNVPSAFRGSARKLVRAAKIKTAQASAFAHA